MSRVVVTIPKAGGKVVPAAKVRGLGLGMRARWRTKATAAARSCSGFGRSAGHGVLPGDQAELPRRHSPRPSPLAIDEDVGATAEDEGVEDVAPLDSAATVLEVDLGVGPGLEAE